MEELESDLSLVKQFYELSHWGRLFFMGLLAVVFIITSGQAVWEIAQPVSQITGVIEDITETKATVRSATYSLALRNGQGELEFVRLRNNGRILNYLQAQEDTLSRQVTASLRQEVVISLAILDGNGITIRESRLSPSLKLLIGLIPLLILLFHVRPNFVQWRV